MKHSHSERSHNESVQQESVQQESVKKPFRGRAIGIAGLMLAGMAGLTIAGITTASADATAFISKEPTPKDHIFVVGARADGVGNDSLIVANTLTRQKTIEACQAAKYKDFVEELHDVINENDKGILVISRGHCI